MKRLNVIVADADRDQLIRNTKQLSRMEGIDIVTSTMYGEEVIQKVYTSDVDVVVTDIVLKGIDGIGVLDAFRKLDRPAPKKLILTRIASDFVQDAVFERGASFFMTKPATPIQLYERIRMLGAAEAKGETGRDYKADIGSLLLKAGISPEMKGHRYLQEAVRIRFSMGETHGKLMEKVYPEIARRFSTSAQSVERAIRTAISSAWKNGAIQKYAVETANSTLLQRKPTAGEMIEHLYAAISISFAVFS
ncbi:MAG: response regulator [Clostridia bacterium]|nr:response regulator [Clostridia bacterium]